MNNETETRDEVRGEVWSIIRRAMDTPQTDNFETESAYRDAWASEAADKVVALVTAARDAEIREALMQPEVVKEAAKEVGALDDRFYDGSAIDAMQCALEAALDHIGLAEEGSE